MSFLLFVLVIFLFGIRCEKQYVKHAFVRGDPSSFFEKCSFLHKKQGGEEEIAVFGTTVFFSGGEAEIFYMGFDPLSGDLLFVKRFSTTENLDIEIKDCDSDGENAFILFTSDPPSDEHLNVLVIGMDGCGSGDSCSPMTKTINFESNAIPTYASIAYDDASLNLFVASETSSFNSIFYVSMITMTGFSKVWEAGFSVGTECSISDLIPVVDGVIVIGTIKRVGQSFHQFFLLKLDLTGTVSSFVFKEAEDIQASMVITTFNETDGFVAYGHYHKDDGVIALFLTKFSFQLTKMWSKDLQLTVEETPWDITKLPQDDGYIISGKTKSFYSSGEKGFYGRIDDNGDFISFKTTDSKSNFFFTSSSLVITSSGIFAVGSVYANAPKQRVYLAKLSNDGKICDVTTGRTPYVKINDCYNDFLFDMNDEMVVDRNDSISTTPTTFTVTVEDRTQNFTTHYFTHCEDNLKNLKCENTLDTCLYDAIDKEIGKKDKDKSAVGAAVVGTVFGTFSLIGLILVFVCLIILCIALIIVAAKGGGKGGKNHRELDDQT